MRIKSIINLHHFNLALFVGLVVVVCFLLDPCVAFFFIILVLKKLFCTIILLLIVSTIISFLLLSEITAYKLDSLKNRGCDPIMNFFNFGPPYPIEDDLYFPNGIFVFCSNSIPNSTLKGSLLVITKFYT